ncbi:hypothetical protein DCC62_21260, partial [candidate division KSB1 bacterium]
DLSNSYAVSNFIINGDRLNFWLPGTTTDVSQSALGVNSLIGNAKELEKTYNSFAVSTQYDEIPSDLDTRRHNALLGQEAFSKALLEYAAKSQVLAKTYDSMAVELQQQVINNKNKFTEAERTQFLLEAVKLREFSNSYYEKYLKYSEEAQALKSQVNKTSKIRYGFFDIGSTRTQ